MGGSGPAGMGGSGPAGMGGSGPAGMGGSGPAGMGRGAAGRGGAAGATRSEHRRLVQAGRDQRHDGYRFLGQRAQRDGHDAGTGTAVFSTTHQVGTGALNITSSSDVPGGYVTVPASLNAMGATTAITIATWVNITTDRAWARIWDFNNSSTTGYMFLTAYRMGRRRIRSASRSR